MNNQRSTIHLSILVPAFNEEAGIEKAMKKLLSCPELKDFELIIVNDGSHDRTGEIIDGLQATDDRVRAIHHRTNRGYGSAIRTAAMSAQGTYLAWYDSDGQHQVQDLLNVVGAVRSRNLDYAIGIRGTDSHQVANRRIGKWILRRVVEFSANQKVSDFNSGLRCFHRDVLLRYLHLLPQGFGASTTTTILMIERGYLGADVPITTLEREGKSSVKQIRDGARTLMIILRLMLLFKPLSFFGTISIMAIASGFIWNFTTPDRTGFSVLSALVISFGVQCGILGLIADQLSALRRERFEIIHHH
jgi:glycosyltransferase involved in cell wall biosynthesis